MSSSPLEPTGSGADDEGLPAGDLPAGDLGVGGPADDPGSGDGPTTPPGYAEEVDPAEGPVAGRGAGQLGDLNNPGAGQPD